MTNNNNVNLKSLRLDAEKGLMSQRLLKVLENLGITTVGDLLEQTKNFDEFSKKLPNGQSIRKDMSNIIKLLKCKYLNEDPKINFKITERLPFYEQFGFSRQVISCLCRSRDFNPDKFIELLYSDSNKLRNITRLGEAGYGEILYKMSIILNYYKSKYKSETEQNERNDANYLVPQFDLACCEIEDLLKKGKLSIERACAVRDKLNGLSNMMDEFINVNFGEELPSFVEQYGYKRK